ncbi:MAG TPA: hypothetical protein VF576_10540 [Rubricoccaceae bacterium]
MRRSLPLALALAAPAVAAQTNPAGVVWPLVPGNSWTYVLSSESYNTAGGGTSGLTGATEWTALDSVDTAEGRLPRLRVASGGTTTDCLVAYAAKASAAEFRLLDAAAAGPCAVPTATFPTNLYGETSFFVVGPTDQDVEVGGEPLGSRPTRSGVEDSAPSSPSTSVGWWTADGLGVLGFSRRVGQTNSGSIQTGTLRQATIAGETVGQPLGSRLDFWPLAAGNEWQFRLVDQTGRDVGTVVWTVETSGSGLTLRTRNVVDGAVEATATCPLSATGASPASAWQTTFALSACALPRPYLAPSIHGQAVPLRIDTYVPGRSTPVGSETVVSDVASGGSFVSGGASGFERSASYDLARGLGPVGFVVVDVPSGGGSPPRWTATLVFARADGRTVGTQAVADETGPEPADLAFTAAPNPSRGGVSLAFALPAAAEVAVEVVDVLGRTVRRVGLGARPAGPGAVRLDVSDLAPGAYTLRLAAGRARAAARVNVVR